MTCATPGQAAALLRCPLLLSRVRLPSGDRWVHLLRDRTRPAVGPAGRPGGGRVQPPASRRLGHERGISFQRTRTWKESTDPDRDAKLDRIEYVTAHFPRCFAFDQFGSLSIRPAHGAAWAREKKPVRLPATYRRTHGVRYFHGCYSLGDDRLWGVIRARKGADHTLAALKSIRAARPGGYRLYVILDNLSANKTPAIRRWAEGANAELCFTPGSASWAKPIPAVRPAAYLRHGRL